MATAMVLVAAALVARAFGQDLFLARATVPGVAPTQKGSTSGAQSFESSCVSDDDHGYPRFQNLDELKASPWAKHFLTMYGELPSSGYPICTFDFWYLPSSVDLVALGLRSNPQKAEGKPHGWQLPTWIGNVVGQYYPGLAYRYSNGEYVNGDLYSQGILGGYTIYRDWYLYQELPSNTWVEIRHDAGPFFKRETEAMWFSRARGSGVWFNVGRTISFNSHTDGFNRMFNGKGDCKRPKPVVSNDPMAMGAVFENALSKCLRSRGYDSFQFRPNPYPVMNTFGSAGWAELASTRLAGKYACGTPQGGPSSFFRSGWKASHVCDCDPTLNVTNCRISITPNMM